MAKNIENELNELKHLKTELQNSQTDICTSKVMSRLTECVLRLQKDEVRPAITNVMLNAIGYFAGGLMNLKDFINQLDWYISMLNPESIMADRVIAARQEVENSINEYMAVLRESGAYMRDNTTVAIKVQIHKKTA